MPRKSRIVLSGIPHHITQRGSKREPVFFCDQDKTLYLKLLYKYCQNYCTEILAYCLMKNHVHLILVPRFETGLAQSLGATHMRYAQIINSRNEWTGHLWQERFFSAPLDGDYLWTALRYVERNPVNAKLVEHAASYEWSSAAAHCKLVPNPFLTNDPKWIEILAGVKDWFEWLRNEEDQHRIDILRQRTLRDLPCGSEAFLKSLETTLGLNMQLKQQGRPKKGTVPTVPFFNEAFDK